MDILLASQNRGKLAEMRQLLAGLPFRVLSPGDLGLHDAPDETGATFLENAREKARHYAVLSQRLTIADDSGLVVDALGGEPGIYSARYGGPTRDDDGRNQLVLERLQGVPDAKRTARFVCALVLVRGGDVLFETEQAVEGRIADAPRGPNGFGYDPIFFYPEFGTTFGEAPPAKKDGVSHRGRAFARLREFLARAGEGLATSSRP
jgi:XTP/dITP diphosphohydrolase